MKNRWVVFALVWVFGAGVFCGECTALDTTEIDRVRAKTTLDATDTQIIDSFWAEGMRELANMRDFATVGEITSAIIASAKSTQAQYVQQYSDAARKYLRAAFDQAGRLAGERQMKIRMNLLIIVDGLGDTRLLDMALNLVNDDKEIIKYWAVHCVTNDTIIDKLNGGGTGASQLASTITGTLQRLPDNSSPEVLVMLAQFGARLSITQAQSLIVKAANARIAAYESWDVKSVLCDAKILKLLAAKISATSSAAGKKDLAMRFGQLYAYVFERYLKGKDILGDKHRGRLAAVLIEVEDKALQVLLGQPQSGIRRAFERNSDSALAQEYGRLFGDETRAGVLGQQFGIEYTRAGQPKRISPFTLPNPPAAPSS